MCLYWAFLGLAITLFLDLLGVAFLSVFVLLARFGRLSSWSSLPCGSSAAIKSISCSKPNTFKTLSTFPTETEGSPFSTFRTVTAVVPARSATSFTVRFLRSLAFRICSPAELKTPGVFLVMMPSVKYSTVYYNLLFI